MIVLCDRPYLVSLLFAVLLSLHLVKFLMFFITCTIITCSGHYDANDYVDASSTSTISSDVGTHDGMSL